MRELIVAEFMSLDGVIQAPGGKDEDTDGGFTQGGWTWALWHDDIGTHFFDTLQTADALLLGRKTWQIHGGAFETMHGDPFADALNGMQKYVVSTTLRDTKLWRNSKQIKADVVNEVHKLKEAPGKNILLDGSSVLVHTLAEAGLVDEYRLHVYPLALVGGKRLFAEGQRSDLKLVEAKPLSNGVIYVRYRRA